VPGSPKHLTTHTSFRVGGWPPRVLLFRVLGIVGSWCSALTLLGCGGSERVVQSSPAAPALPATKPDDRPNLSACGPTLGAPNRRLTRFELAYAIEDALGVSASALHDLPRPPSSIGSTPDILVGRLLDTSPRFLAPYQKEIARLSDVTAERIAAECSTLPDADGCVVAALREPAARLFRATLTDDELRALGTGAEGPRALARTIIFHLLDSPRFYRVANEVPPSLSTEGADAERLFSRRRLATRLALALHSSVPDTALLRRAESGVLEDAHALEAEVSRLIRDPRFSRFGREFTRQWLRTDRPPLFRASLDSRTLIDDAPRFRLLEEQTAAFFGNRLDAPVRDLLAGDAGGLLTSGAVLSALSTRIRNGGDESLLGRGLVIESALLCRTFPLAAVYAEELWNRHPLLDPVLAETTQRPGEHALLATRTTDRPCRECHRQLETLGAALGGYDAFGQPIANASTGLGRMADVALSGPRELAEFVLESGRFEPCVAEKLLTYLTGRAVSPHKREQDRCLVDALAGPPGAPSRSSITAWLTATLASPAFREQGREVVHDVPFPSPNADGYRVAVPPVSLAENGCTSFDAGRFLVTNCGTSACHGEGAATAPFAVRDAEAARVVLLAARPAPDGYCTEHERLVDPERPRESLVIQKLVAGAKVCGSVMPITGGPLTLAPTEHACFVRWVEGAVAGHRPAQRGARGQR
jgi:hypothetical protein